MRLEIAERVGHGGIELDIRNEGQGPAKNITFDLEGDPTYFAESGIGQPIDQVPFIKNGLPYLGPDRHFRFVLGWLRGDAFDRASQKPWTFHIHYENLSGKLLSDSYTLDFSQFSGLIVGGGPPLIKIEKHVEALQTDLHRLMTGFSKLHVLTQTKDEFRKEMEDLREQQRRKNEDVKPTSGNIRDE